MKITKNINIAIGFTAKTVSFIDSKGAGWDHLIYIGRCLEEGNETMRAYQLKVFWFSLSVWKTNCSPLVHGFHVKS